MKTIEMASPSAEIREIPVSEFDEVVEEVYLRGQEGYAEARAIWNGMITTEPAVVVCPKDTEEVVRAVRVARDNNLAVGVRGGGHNVAGTCLVQDGLLINLRNMRRVEVDPTGRVARVQGGATLGDLDAATQTHGLVTPSGFVSATGIAGLTLRGGLGHLMRRFGLACDNLIGGEVVTADSEARQVSESDNPGLLWAMRGGGVNLGVVTRFDFQLHELGDQVTHVMPVYPASRGKEVMRFVDEQMAGAPDELGMIGFYAHLPDEEKLPEPVRDREVFVLYGCFSGNEKDSDKVTGPFCNRDGLLADLSSRMPYTEIQKFLDGDYPDEKRYYWRSLYLDELSDEMLDIIHRYGTERPSPGSTLDIWTLGGEVDRVDPQSTAFSKRGARYMLAVEANWGAPELDDKAMSWARAVTKDLERFAKRGVYINFAGTREEMGTTLSATYGPNLEKLMRVKRSYDPENIFG